MNKKRAYGCKKFCLIFLQKINFYRFLIAEKHKNQIGHYFLRVLKELVLSQVFIPKLFSYVLKIITSKKACLNSLLLYRQNILKITKDNKNRTTDLDRGQILP